VNTRPATDISTFAFWERPEAERFETFRWLREHDPVSWHPPAESLLLPPELNTEGFWAVTRAEHVEEVSRNADVFSSARGVFMEDMPEVVIAASLSFLAMDGDEHRQLRNIVRKAFSPKRIRTMEDWIRGHARDMVAELAPLGGGDLCKLLTKELPGRIYATYIGAEDDDLRREIVTLADRLVSWNDPEYTVAMSPLEVFTLAAERLADIALELAGERRAKPGDDMVSWLVQAEVDGRAMEDWEISSFFVMLSGAANDTTANLTASSLVTLDQHPDQKQWLLEDFEGRIDNAIEELLRFNPPLMHFRRTATRDYTLGGQEIRAGEKVVIWYQSACQDEALFPEPEKLDLARPNAAAHVAFGGGGPHFCLGAELGRQLAKCTLREVYGQLPDFHLTDVEYKFSNFISGIRRARAVWTPPATG